MYLFDGAFCGEECVDGTNGYTKDGEKGHTPAQAYGPWGVLIVPIGHWLIVHNGEDKDSLW